MEFDSGIPLPRAAVTELPPSAPSWSLSEDALWQMNLRSMETGSYPERPDEPDCSYYIRTGLCRFGATCRFNHPPDRKLVIATAWMKGEYPERFGLPECQYYLKTGSCKFGAACMFHHPRDKAGIAGRVSLNVLGYPLRPSEIECAYYLRTGQCQFGSTCKFHHPQTTNTMVSFHGSRVYPTIQSPTTSQQSYQGDFMNWSRDSRPSFVPIPRGQDLAPVILPQELVSVQGWNAYSGSLGSVSASENSQVFRVLRQNQSEVSFSPYRAGSVPVGYYALQRDNVFPERPDQPECQFYMKTGDCKFGIVCRFHHPRERSIPDPDCVLSALGLPLRPGEPLCLFYSRYGICKFGPSCKFDHPISHNLSSSQSLDYPVRQYTQPRRHLLLKTRQAPSSGDHNDLVG